jgi:hypothetical protein
MRRASAFVSLVAAFASGILAATGGCTTDSLTSTAVQAEAGADIGEPDGVQPDTALDGSAPLADASGEAEPSDAGLDAVGDTGTGCDLAKPFGMPSVVAGLEKIGAPRSLSADELTAYGAPFDTGTGAKLGVSTRPSLVAPFGDPTVLDGGVALDCEQQSPVVTPDGLTIFFTSNFWQQGSLCEGKAGSGQSQIFVSQRATKADPFGVATPLPLYIAANTSLYLLPDGKTLYYDVSPSVMVTTCQLGDAGPLCDAPATIDLGGAVYFPVVTSDALTIFFASDRATPGTRHIFRGTRATKNDPFSGIAPVAELTTVSPESPLWMTPDDCTLYFTSLRNGSSQVFTARHGQ